MGIPEMARVCPDEFAHFDISRGRSGGGRDARIICVEGLVVTRWNDFYGNPSFLLSADGRALKMDGGSENDELFRAYAELPVSDRIDTGCWFLEEWSGNYYHWVVRHLPKLAWVKRVYPDCRLVMPVDYRLADWQRDSLAVLGFQRSDILCVEMGKAQFLRGFTFDLPFDTSEPVVTMASRVTATEEPLRGKRLYVSRDRATRRRVTNEAAVRGILCRYGFEIVFPERMTFSEQVGLFAAANVIVGAHGAGLANIVWAKSGSVLIEITNSVAPPAHYRKLAEWFGIDYYGISACLPHGGHDADLVADVRLLEGKLAEVLQ